MIGIYKITCIGNGKIYIGQSTNIETRWKDHIRRLKTGKHDNQHLQNAFNKYGDKSFIFEVIEECDNNFDELNRLEIKYIRMLKATDRKIGFNISSGGGNAYSLYGKSKEEIKDIYKRIVESRIKKWSITGNPKKGTHISDEQKKHLSKINTGKLHPMYGKKRKEHSEKMKGRNNPRAKKVVCINTLEVFECAKYAGERYNTTNSNILKCCKHKQATAGKDSSGNRLSWMYLEEYIDRR